MQGKKYLQVLEAGTFLCHRTPEKIAASAPSQRGYLGEDVCICICLYLYLYLDVYRELLYINT